MKLEMQATPGVTGLLIVGAAFALLWIIVPYLKGKMKSSAKGIVFPLKNYVHGVLTVAIAIALGPWIDAFKRHHGAFWGGALTAAIVTAVALAFLPGPIEMTRTGIGTSGGLSLKRRNILFTEVAHMDLVDDVMRVTGMNGTVIEHTRWHVNAERFREEMHARANKPAGPALLI